jgi:hypothetical protein
MNQTGPKLRDRRVQYIRGDFKENKYADGLFSLVEIDLFVDKFLSYKFIYSETGRVLYIFYNCKLMII